MNDNEKIAAIVGDYIKNQTPDKAILLALDIITHFQERIMQDKKITVEDEDEDVETLQSAKEVIAHYY